MADDSRQASSTPEEPVAQEPVVRPPVSPFVHLRLHSEYSLTDSLVRIKPLAQALVELQQPAVALTDHANLYALVKFYRAALSQGIKPIVGADLTIQNDPAEPSSTITLLAQNDQGYLNLKELISKGYLDGQLRGQPTIRKAWLEGHTDGLIALSGAQFGDVGRAILSGQVTQAQDLLRDYQRLFPQRYYLEVQRTGRADEEHYINSVLPLATDLQLPVVATNDVRFLQREDFEAHEARVCVSEGLTLDDPRRVKRYSDQQYLRSSAEMAELFADIPEAITNTIKIAQRCNVTLDLGTPVLPDYPVPEGQTEADFMRSESEHGLKHRFVQLGITDTDKQKTYYDRLERELGVIEQMGFPGYFLIVADFIRWAKENDVPVGPGRGSGAGSLVAYVLDITDLDPIEYDLLFERFLNPERVSMPDFDIDFCMDGRDRVIDYVARTYGRDKVSQIITFGTMAAKAVVRDVSRVLGHPYGFGDRLAKAVPFEVGMTLDKAVKESPDLQKLLEEEDVQIAFELAKKLEGLSRNVGKHAGGVVISPSKLTDFTPLYVEQGGENLVAQFDKDDVEAVGLVKFDFLGLRTLTIIDNAVKAINQHLASDQKLDIATISLTDEAAFDLLKACQTTAVFQLESAGMKDLIKRLQPDSFEDIVALVALFRPGPLQSGMVDDFIARKHGRATVSYPHEDVNLPALEPVLKPTYGIILYQEQVMQIAQVLANYTLGGADLLRRAMGKKKQEEMDRQRAIFVEGATQHGLSADDANFIFDLVDKFAGYGFNKSHSAAYALLSYQTAWLKAHYPAAFMASVLSADIDHTDKIVTLIDECRAMEIEVQTPSVNRSAYRFEGVEAKRQVIYGLGAIKGVGEAAIESVIEERDRGGAFSNIVEFCRRIDTTKVNRRNLEALICAGAMDDFGNTRAALMGQLSTALQMAQQHAEAASAGQDDLFGLFADEQAEDTVEEPALDLPDAPEWPERERLAREKDALGLYLTGHPITEYLKEVQQFTSGAIVDYSENMMDPPSQQGYGRRRDQKQVTVAGLVIGLRQKKGRAFLELDDSTGRIEVVFFDESFEQYRHLLVKDELIIVEGGLSFSDFNNAWQVRGNRVLHIDDAREEFVKRIEIDCQAPVVTQPNALGLVERLHGVLTPWRGGRCPIVLYYQNMSAKSELRLGREWRVNPSDDLIRQLRDLEDITRVDLIYR